MRVAVPLVALVDANDIVDLSDDHATYARHAHATARPRASLYLKMKKDNELEFTLKTS